MDSTVVLNRVRRSGPWSLRVLATRSHTSHATLSAYLKGRVTPSVDTLSRIVRSAGCDLDARVTRRVIEVDGLDRGEELVAVLRLAEAFPSRPTSHLGPERFGR